jgi:hypothetical protein
MMFFEVFVLVILCNWCRITPQSRDSAGSGGLSQRPANKSSAPPPALRQQQQQQQLSRSQSAADENQGDGVSDADSAHDLYWAAAEALSQSLQLLMGVSAASSAAGSVQQPAPMGSHGSLVSNHSYPYPTQQQAYTVSNSSNNTSTKSLGAPPSNAGNITPTAGAVQLGTVPENDHSGSADAALTSDRDRRSVKLSEPGPAAAPVSVSIDGAAPASERPLSATLSPPANAGGQQPQQQQPQQQALRPRAPPLASLGRRWASTQGPALAREGSGSGSGRGGGSGGSGLAALARPQRGGSARALLGHNASSRGFGGAVNAANNNAPPTPTPIHNRRDSAPSTIPTNAGYGYGYGYGNPYASSGGLWSPSEAASTSAASVAGGGHRRLGSVPSVRSMSLAQAAQLQLTSQVSRPFTDAEVSLVESLAVSAGVCLNKALLFSHVLRAQRKAEALLDIVKATASERSFFGLVDRVVNAAYHALAADKVTVFLVDFPRKVRKYVLDLGYVCAHRGVAGAVVRRLTRHRGLARVHEHRHRRLGVPYRQRSQRAGCVLAPQASRGAACMILLLIISNVRFDRAVDVATNYRTKSMLCLPVKDAKGRTLAVVQVR